MQSTNTIQLLFKLLSVFLLTGAMHLTDISPTKTSENQETTFVETKSNSSIFNVEYLLTESTAFNWITTSFLLGEWLSLTPIAISEVFTGLQYYAWPEHSRINSYQSIFKYQHYISSLISTF